MKDQRTIENEIRSLHAEMDSIWTREELAGMILSSCTVVKYQTEGGAIVQTPAGEKTALGFGAFAISLSSMPFDELERLEKSCRPHPFLES